MPSTDWCSSSAGSSLPPLHLSLQLLLHSNFCRLCLLLILTLWWVLSQHLLHCWRGCTLRSRFLAALVALHLTPSVCGSVMVRVAKGQFFYTEQNPRAKFYPILKRTKLTKRIVLENECWQLYQIRLVYTQKSNIGCANLPKIGFFGDKLRVLPELSPQSANISILHIYNILQLL